MATFEEFVAQVADLPLARRIKVLDGKGWFVTEPLPELDRPVLSLADGPHGLRLLSRDSASLTNSDRATCFPPAVALASSFDVNLAEQVGRAIGEEAVAEGVHVVLGPGINLKRVPVCGRNFEYFSEDPLVSAGMATGWIRGVQSQGVGTSLKHFAANNQETRRMTVSADVDERPLFELYLRSFMNVVLDAQPWTVMCSYNRINGVWASQDPWLLTTVLRATWGYDGLVVSDWGAVVDRPASLRAGLDLQMPADAAGAPSLTAAFERGELDEDVVNRSVARLVQLMDRCGRRDKGPAYDRAAHHQLAREVATRCAVLLKNDNDILPLDPTTTQTIAVVGAFATTPRVQGSGSSRVTPNELDNPLDELKALAPAATFLYEAGFPEEGPFDPDTPDAQAAYRAAAQADVVVAFLGNPESYESEGFDQLTTPGLPQLEFLQRVVAANARTVVVLTNGLVVDLAAWIDVVPAVLEGWLLGEGAGGAIADLLFGRANPSGRLAETIAHSPHDHPSFLNFPGELDHVRYGEGLAVGYRAFQMMDRAPLFPFGFGLSYTSFTYDDLRATADENGLHVAVGVTNTGGRAGHEVVQIYLAPAAPSRVLRPPQELKGFATVALDPGERRVVTVTIPRRDLAYFDVDIHDWTVEGLTYRVSAGASSADLRLSVEVAVAGDAYEPPLTAYSTVAQWRAHPVGGPLLDELYEQVDPTMRAVFSGDTTLARMVEDFRLTQMMGFVGLTWSAEAIAAFVARAQ